MLKKVWFMFVLWSVLVVSGCSGKQTENAERNVVSKVEISETDVAENLESDVSLEAEFDVIGNSDTSVETGQTQTSDVESSTTEAPSETETVTTQPTTPSAATQPTTL